MRSLFRYLLRNHAFVLFILLETLALVMVFNYNSFQRAKYLNSANRITGNIYNMYHSIARYFDLVRVNRELAEDNARLRSMVQEQPESPGITAPLSADTPSVQSLYRFTPAKVINNSVNRPFNYITLNKGRKHGIQPDQGIMSARGIVGVVAQVSESYAMGLSVLNPRWSVEYLQDIRDFLADQNDNNQTSHVLLATHNPIAVAELTKEQVQILKRDEETLRISAEQPTIDPIGMGYAGVITSSMFGLSAALDTTTQELLEKQRVLSAKEQLDVAEQHELEVITSRLGTLGFRYQMRDPVYTEYLRARSEQAENIMHNTDAQDAQIDPDLARRLVREALAQMQHVEDS